MIDQACQTPLVELLEGVPADARMTYEHHSTHHQMIPVGRLCHEAAAAIRAARPTADLGEDGEFVERLRIMARRYDLGAALPDDDLIRVTLLEAAARLEECRALLSRSGDD